MEILQYAKPDKYDIGNDIVLGKDNFVLACGGRNIGKTFSTKAWLWNRVATTGMPFITLGRDVGELDMLADTMFDNLQANGYLQDVQFYSYDIGRGIGKKLCIVENSEEVCVSIMLSLKKSDIIRKMSLENTCAMFFDEVISESGSYLRNEPNRLLSVYVTALRNRRPEDFPVVLLGNINGYYCPYYGQWNIEIPTIGETQYFNNGKIKFINLPDKYDKGTSSDVIGEMSESYSNFVNNNTLSSLPIKKEVNCTHISKIIVGNRCLSYDYKEGYLYFSLIEDTEGAIIAMDGWGNKPIDTAQYCSHVVRSVKRAMASKRIFYDSVKCYSVVMELTKLYW